MDVVDNIHIAQNINQEMACVYTAVDSQVKKCAFFFDHMKTC